MFNDTENGLEHVGFHRFIQVLGPDDRGMLYIYL